MSQSYVGAHHLYTSPELLLQTHVFQHARALFLESVCLPVCVPATSLHGTFVTIPVLHACLSSHNSTKQHFCCFCRSDIPYGALWGADPVLDRSHVLLAVFLQPTTRFKPFAEQLSKHLVGATSHV